ncbi:hypothetical protein LTR99_010472 [Exophiala xenobiotica]|uniref:MaoC-like domain-containing protein n=1 Tax=Vermiconidia calcicola TaxID=1690605 RepID=A0AAV9PS79_9PEZI|nr:hypothetical protein LTR92_007575 [Exophiala xenobiotica]KAK5528629.1 hypothetical protein LTR25_010242 [Vermiconidia calcicola]KAK5546053.1 hypothetical protein LTR23_003860 [Chaetothyriales sp. CCFEE 6169]KAK5220613.1 hypothetical protein LTR72_007235 [Exophiala xenobiotica]KAK5267696.1 hypothetical protein LTR96_007024 [Exophiala xenobiotica]
MPGALRPRKLHPCCLTQVSVRHTASDTQAGARTPLNKQQLPSDVPGTPFSSLRGRRLRTPNGAWDTRNSESLLNALGNHLTLANAPNNRLFPGFQQASFNLLVNEKLLCEDGADARYVPGKDWKFRVWVGGRMDFRMPWMSWSTETNNGVCTVEKVSDIQINGDLANEDAKVMVTLTKSYLDGHKILRNGSFRWSPLKDALPYVTEKKHLCFMRQVPASLRSVEILRKIPPPVQPFYAQTMVPSAALLFRFSAVTNNDHRIHLDTEFTQRVYGIPKLLVHGPLTAVLMLEVLRKSLEIYAGAGPSIYAVKHFDYKNLMPLFVDEKITIACKKSDTADSDDEQSTPRIDGSQEKWQVWIQKGQGENATLAVKGKAIVTAHRKEERDGIQQPVKSPANSVVSPEL